MLGTGGLIVVTGCAGSTDSESEEEEDSCPEEYTEQFCHTEDFALAVQDRIETFDGAPEVIDAGVYISGETDEPIEGRALMYIKPDRTNFQELAEDVGFVAGAFAYHIEDYDVSRMDVIVYADSEAEEVRGRFFILAEWAEAYVNDEMTNEEYVTTVMGTTQTPE